MPEILRISAWIDLGAFLADQVGLMMYDTAHLLRRWGL